MVLQLCAFDCSILPVWNFFPHPLACQANSSQTRFTHHLLWEDWVSYTFPVLLQHLIDFSVTARTYHIVVARLHVYLYNYTTSSWNEWTMFHPLFLKGFRTSLTKMYPLGIWIILSWTQSRPKRLRKSFLSPPQLPQRIKIRAWLRERAITDITLIWMTYLCGRANI